MGHLSRILRPILFAGAALYLAVYLFVALSRISYPFELEWMEGGSVDHVARVLDGKPLYGPPSMDFIPYVYPPLYYQVSAAAARVTGLGFFPLRLVSFLASLGSLLLIFFFVRRETGRPSLGFLSAAFYAATFGASGAWFDLARVDSLFLFFLLGGIYLLRFHEGPWTGAAAALLFALSFFTKQTALIFAAGMTIQILAARRGKTRFVFPILFLGLLGVGTAWLNIRSGGWFSFYAFTLPAGHPFVKRMFLEFWGSDLAKPFGLTLIGSGFFLAALRGHKDPRFSFFALLLTCALTAAFLSRLHSGGYVNVLMPLHAVLALFFGPALAHFPAVDPARRSLAPWAAGIGLLQFAALFYFPDKLVPSQSDLNAGQTLVEKLKQFPGEVFVPNHGFWPARAGKKTHAQAMALGDILLSGQDAVKARIDGEVRESLRSGRFEAVVVDDTTWGYFDDIRKFYDYGGPAFASDSVFWPSTGMPTRPQAIYIFRKP